jgi:VanZ family protein
MEFIALWLPVAAWAGLIFALSSIPHLKTNWGIWDFILRKCAHIFEYAVLAGLLARALRGSTRLLSRPLIVWAWVLSAAYAGTDEFHQTFVAGRVGCLSDVCIDVVGVTVGCWGWHWWMARLKHGTT